MAVFNSILSSTILLGYVLWLPNLANILRLQQYPYYALESDDISQITGHHYLSLLNGITRSKFNLNLKLIFHYFSHPVFFETKIRATDCIIKAVNVTNSFLFFRFGCAVPVVEQQGFAGV